MINTVPQAAEIHAIRHREKKHKASKGILMFMSMLLKVRWSPEKACLVSLISSVKSINTVITARKRSLLSDPLPLLPLLLKIFLNIRFKKPCIILHLEAVH